MIDLSLFLLNNYCGIYSNPKESKHRGVFLTINNKIKCVSLLCFQMRLITYPPPFIIDECFLEKTLTLGA